ncbi:MAG TPA: type II toxin-antitoxin system RelE/ParE family toxin [Acidimicrobiales bacterium]|nr:type II toxin-antitoxin system RelE/ParE family toxin [Acidimicrobiales bacterium]
MSWEVLKTEKFEEWWATLTDDQQDAVIASVDILADQGPTLGRPLVDRITGSRHHNMKELRVSKGGALRILFAFDPLRRAVLLLGGDKYGNWTGWYQEAIPVADDLFDAYLQDLRREGLIP